MTVMVALDARLKNLFFAEPSAAPQPHSKQWSNCDKKGGIWFFRQTSLSADGLARARIHDKIGGRLTRRGEGGTTITIRAAPDCKGKQLPGWFGLLVGWGHVHMMSALGEGGEAQKQTTVLISCVSVTVTGWGGPKIRKFCRHHMYMPLWGGEQPCFQILPY